MKRCVLAILFARKISRTVSWLLYSNGMVYTKNDFGVDLPINLVIYKTTEPAFAG